MGTGGRALEVTNFGEGMALFTSAVEDSLVIGSTYSAVEDDVVSGNFL